MVRVMVALSAAAGVFGLAVFAITYPTLTLPSAASLAISTLATWVNAIAIEVDRRQVREAKEDT